MDYEIDYEIRRTKEKEFTSLYQWSLQEFSKEGEPVGGKVIPWKWGADFTATDMSYVMEARRRGFSDEPAANENDEYILAALIPERYVDGELEDDSRFSMLGTSRQIEKIFLRITRLEPGATQSCKVWSTVANSYENDFRHYHQPDRLQFDVQVEDHLFDLICTSINEPNVSLSLSVSHVPGFYAEWSPSISTHNIKVLAGVPFDEQPIVSQGEFEDEPPRCGVAKEFDLTLVRKATLELPRTVVTSVVEDEDLHPDDQPLRPVDTNARETALLLKNINVISALKTPLWLIVVLLAIIAFVRSPF